MGDRTGLTKLDRTNGFDGGLDYERVKKSKLAHQNELIREALRNRKNTTKTDLFKGISINVNGRTQPSADELKRLILLNGGDYHPYYKYKTTKFMIATNLSMARMKQLRQDDRVIRPEWITESIQVNCLLPYEDYQIFAEEPRGKTGSVLTLNTKNSSTFGQASSIKDRKPVAYSSTKSYRKSKRNHESHTVTKSRDIRDMFSKVVRNIDTNKVKKNDTLRGSQDPSGDCNSREVFPQTSEIIVIDEES